VALGVAVAEAVAVIVRVGVAVDVAEAVAVTVGVTAAVPVAVASGVGVVVAPGLIEIDTLSQFVVEPSLLKGAVWSFVALPEPSR
jgi:hypothetical protein